MKNLIDLSLKDTSSYRTYYFVDLSSFRDLDDILESNCFIGLGKNKNIRDESRVIVPMTIKKYF